MHQISYPDRDYNFGQMMLRLRSAIGLTQSALGDNLGVSRRAILKWEDGSNYPKALHLKQLITLAFEHQGFQAGHEDEEIRFLWHASHQKNLLDEVWLQSLLTPSTSTLSELKPGQHTTSFNGSEHLSAFSQLKDSGPYLDWNDAQAVPAFYGREWELQLLTGWITNERCRVVSLLGMGGMGKSALAVTLMHQLSNEFDVVIWRSLRDANNCEALLDEYFQVLAPQEIEKASLSIERRISQLLEYLRIRRVLLVLDNLESLLLEGEGNGNMRPGYEAYGQLLRRIGETSHQSCLVLTSREKPADLIALEGNRSPVRVLHLARLGMGDCEQLLADKEIKGVALDQERLIEAYTGNPLALKIVAQTIVELFDGEIGPFLEQGEIIFGGVRELLDQQFLRLSALEQSILLWFAIMREPTTFDDLVSVLVRPVSRSRLLEAVEALRRRSLIERGHKPGSFTLQSVVLEYATLRLITEATVELKQGKLVRLLEYGLVLAHAKDYVRQSQERLLLAPLLTELQNGSVVGKASLLNRFNAYFNELRTLNEDEQGYGPANLVSLVRWLQGDVKGLDLSRLVLRDVYLQGVQMQNTDLSEATIRDSIFTGTTGSIAAMAISSNGKYLVATNFSGELLVWKAYKFTLHRVWKATNIAYISRFSLSPDGRTIVLGVQFGGVEIRELDTGRLLRTLISDASHSLMYEVAFAPDGRKFAVTLAEKIVGIWEAETGRELQTLPHPDEIPVLMWSSDGHLLASGDINGIIRLWEVPENGIAILLQTLTGHTREVVGLAFAPDGLTLASASWDGTVKLWDVSSGNLWQTLTGHKDRVSRVAWSPDGRTLASGGRDSDPSIWLWDVEQATYRAVLLGHNGVVRGLAFTPDSARLLSSGADGTLRLWDAASGQSMRVLESYRFNPNAHYWSPDNTRLVTSSTDSLITIYDLTGKLPPRLLHGNLAYLAAVSWSPDGRWIVASERNNAMRLWNAETGEFVHLFEQSDRSGLISYSMSWSPDGRWLASGTGTLGVMVWDVIEYRLRWVAKPFPVEICEVEWYPDGTRLAASGSNGNIYIFDATDGTLLRQVSAKYNPYIFNMEWSPDGTLLATLCNRPDGSGILVLNTQSWEEELSFSPLSGRGGMVCWNPGGKILISCTLEGAISWWDVQSGECLRVVEAHAQGMNSLEKSPDGTRLSSCGNDGNIKLWDINTGELLQTIRREKPYERLNITGIRGLTEAQKANLRALGAVEEVS